MKRLIGLSAVLALCLPMVGEGQSIDYTKPSSSALLYNEVVSLTTAGTSEELLYTMTVPFSAVGTTVDFVVKATHAANTNTAFFTLRAGQGAPLSNTTLGSTVGATSGGTHLDWQTCTRMSSSELVCWRGEYYAPAITAGGIVVVTGLDFSSPVTVAVTGRTATQAGDITVQFIQARVR